MARRGPGIFVLALTGVVALGLAGCGSSGKKGVSSGTSSTAAPGTSAPPGTNAPTTKSAPGVSANAITVGFVTTTSGPAAPTFSDSAGGAEARFALQNAQGGVNGRQLKMIVKDDQSSPTGSQTAAEALAAGNVFGVIEDSAIDTNYETGNKVLAATQVPTISWGSDTQDSNTFGSWQPNIGQGGKVGGSYYTYDIWAPFMKSVGITKLAAVSYASIKQSIQILLDVAKMDGLPICYENVTAPIGSVDFTAPGLTIKNLGCNGVLSIMEDSSVVGLGTALKNTGSKAAQVLETGYDQAVLSQPGAASALDGSYIGSSVNMTNPNPATASMLDALKKYDHSYTGGIPDLGTWEAYLSADLMIKGLQMAGPNPTRAAFISDLRTVNNWDAEGILAAPLDFTHFGTAAALPATSCQYFMELKGGAFVSTNNAKPWCGRLVQLSSP